MTAASMSDGGEAGPKPDRGEILKALALVAGPCQTIELRALEVRPRRGFPQTFSGYFRDQEQLADAAVEANPYAMGTYVTLNPVDPALFARAPNIVRLVSKHDPLTKDHEIVERHLLLIDVDPKRPAGVSASEAEHAAALQKQVEIQGYLNSLGWPEPLSVDSGNGGHLVLGVRLPNTPDAAELLHKVLDTLAKQFDSDSVKVDTKNFNAARIWKLPGSVGRKGAHALERPHRLARILSAPERLIEVPRELLEDLAAHAPTGSGHHPKGLAVSSGPDARRVAQGQRHKHLVSRAGALVRCHIPPQAVAAALQVVNTQTCDEPLSDEEVERIAIDICKKYAPVDLGTQAPDVGLQAFVFDPDQEPPDDLAYYDGFMSAGDVVLWLGREKHRKTNVILQFCIGAATGRDFLIFRFAAQRPLKVVIVDYETKTTSLRLRYEAISEAMKLSVEERRLLRENLRIVEVRKLLRAGRSFPRFPLGGARSKESEEAALKAENFWQRFKADYPADIYVFDPMRSMHSADENDSSIESLLGRLRGFFPDSAVVVAHHMRKFLAAGKEITLQADMRLWSDGARGSSAIKAHSDTIVCQERTMTEDHSEVLHVGAFLKDGADVEPLPLEESDAESFFWEVTADIPEHLRNTVTKLQEAGGIFEDNQSAVAALLRVGIKRPTAYRHLTELKRRGWLVQQEGHLELRVSVSPISMALDDFEEPGKGKKPRK